jgi:hypothetical protein
VISSPISRLQPVTIPDPEQAGKEVALKRWDFRVQFVWKPTPLSKRIELREQKAKGAQDPALAGGAPGVQ